MLVASSIVSNLTILAAYSGFLSLRTSTESTSTAATSSDNEARLSSAFPTCPASHRAAIRCNERNNTQTTRAPVRVSYSRRS
jgi:hypothetical protein